MPDGQMKIRYRLRNEGTHADHSEATDCQIIANDASGADRSAFLHKSWQRMFIRFRGPQFFQVRCGRSRESIVGEDCSCTDHHTIFNGHRSTYVYEGINLHSVANT